MLAAAATHMKVVLFCPCRGFEKAEEHDLLEAQEEDCILDLLLLIEGIQLRLV